MYIKQGDRGKDVSEVQKLLSLLGYDLIIDGDFGAKTTRSIRSFQKKNGLDMDGVVGNNTYNALKASLKRGAKETGGANSKQYGDLKVSQHALDTSQYIKQVFPKKQIYLHFTAGSPSAKNVISWWDSNDPRIATAYVIDGNDGSVVEAFEPDYWSYHLGIKGTRGKVDKHSIGIEVCNWGPITKKGDKFFTYVNKEISADEVFELDTPHRGYKYYHKYTEAQLENLEKLLIYLVKEYDIPVQDTYGMDWFDYQADVIQQLTPGIWNHTTVRKDKYDMAPQPEFIAMLNGLKGKL